jgi:hypothetical protein
MTWVRIDDGFAQHPKVAGVGPLGMALQVAGLCYCNRNMTDGFIPWSVAHSLLSWRFVDPETSPEGKRRLFTIAVTSGMRGDDCDSEYVIGLLVMAGMWDEVDGGFLIHDYTDYQPTKAQIEAERAQKIAAGQAGGKARALALANTPAKADGQAESKPVPVPVPDSETPIPLAAKAAEKRGADALLADSEFISELRGLFPNVRFDYEVTKWQDHVQTKPPKGNYKNSLRNWMERATEFAKSGTANGAAPADPSFFEDRYRRVKEAT